METDHVRLLFSEVGRVFWLSLLVMLLLLIGWKADVVGGMAADMMGVSVSGRWEWTPTPTTDPWRLEDEDLDYQRVVNNWVTKPGMRWLGVQLVVLIFGVGLILANAKSVVKTVVKNVYKLRKVKEDIGVFGNKISGSVRISTRAGVIYMSNVQASLTDTLEEYAMMLSRGNVRVEIVIS